MNKNMMKQLQQMQNKLAKIQEELGNTTVEGSAGGGAVKAVVDGHQNLKSITIAQEAVDPSDVETLQDMVLAAVQDAMENSRKVAQTKMAPLTGGLGIPGM